MAGIIVHYLNHEIPVNKAPEPPKPVQKRPFEKLSRGIGTSHITKTACAYTNCQNEVGRYFSLEFLNEPICAFHYKKEYQQLVLLPGKPLLVTKMCAYKNCSTPYDLRHSYHSRLIIGDDNFICAYHYGKERDLLGSFSATPRGSLSEERRTKYFKQISEWKRRTYKQDESSGDTNEMSGDDVSDTTEMNENEVSDTKSK